MDKDLGILVWPVVMVMKLNPLFLYHFLIFFFPMLVADQRKEQCTCLWRSTVLYSHLAVTIDLTHTTTKQADRLRAVKNKGIACFRDTQLGCWIHSEKWRTRKYLENAQLWCVYLGKIRNETCCHLSVSVHGDDACRLDKHDCRSNSFQQPDRQRKIKQITSTAKT